MSNLDMTNSFWQVPLHPKPRQCTAFQYKDRSYKFRVVLFGLKMRTAVWIRGLDQALQGMGNHIHTFVKDNLITSESHIKK